jgi:membrane peptidoglycan carboxypeptidase
MRSRVLRWLAVLSCIAAATAGLGYWGYASITDQYIDAAFGAAIARNPSLVGTPALQKAFEARWQPSGRATPEMQLARSAVVLHEGRILQRELLEMMIGRRLNQRFSRDQILALYAHTVYLGQAGGVKIVGVDKAASLYLGKRAEDLDTAEAAWMASLARQPNHLLSHPELALKDRNDLIDRMAEAKLISPDEATSARNQPLPVPR